MTTGNISDPPPVRNFSDDSSTVDAILSPSGPWDSLGYVTTAALIVFVLSPLIICSNALLIVAIHKFKRLRNPSNYFLLSLASADLGVGLCLPFGLYFEISKDEEIGDLLCVFPYCVLILLCSVSLLSITAVAVDRYTSLASPLRYNNIITHRSVGRYVSAFWIYSLLTASVPIVAWHWQDQLAARCSFNVISYRVRIFLFCFLFAPCCLVIVGCYGYVYVIARSHARAIFSVEVSFRQTQATGSAEARYGRTLAVTVGLFLLLWCPFNVCILIGDIGIHATFFLGLLLLSNSAVDPWIYGFRNAEFRTAFIKILDDLLPKLSRTLQKHSPNGGAVTSYASNIRLCVTPQHQPCVAVGQCSAHLQVPEAAVEVTTVTSPFLSPSSANGAVAAAQV